jgi:hypothetical protein
MVPARYFSRRADFFVRGVPMTQVRRILFASDLSKASAKPFATAVALALAKSSHASITILHVLTPFTSIIPEQFVDGTALEQLNRDMRMESQRTGSEI